MGERLRLRLLARCSVDAYFFQPVSGTCQLPTKEVTGPRAKRTGEGTISAISKAFPGRVADAPAANVGLGLHDVLEHPRRALDLKVRTRDAEQAGIIELDDPAAHARRLLHLQNHGPLAPNHRCRALGRVPAQSVQHLVTQEKGGGRTG